MTDRHDAAEHWLQTAAQAFAVGDRARAEQAMERLSQALQGPPDPVLMRQRGEAAVLTGLLALHRGRVDAAVAAWRSACDVCAALASHLEADRLAAYLCRVPSMLIEGLPAGAAPLPEGTFFGLFAHLLRHALARPELPSLERCDEEAVAKLLASAGHMQANVPPCIRLVIASLAFGLGMSGTHDQHSGIAMPAYVLSNRMLDGLPATALTVRLVVQVYQAMAFERQRNGDFDGMRRSVDRLDRALERMGVDETFRQTVVAQGRSSAEMDAAIWSNDTEAAARHASTLVRDTPHWLMDPASERARFLRDIAEGRLPRAPDVPEGALGHPGRGLAEGRERLDGPLTEDTLLAWLRDSFGDDGQVAWRVAAFLGKGLGAVDLPLLAILFGKVAVRRLQALRMEAAKTRFWTADFDPFRHDIAQAAARLLQRQLVAQARVGEALRYAGLLEASNANLPPPTPRVATIPLQVDESCPLTLPERKTMEAVQRRWASPASRGGDVRNALRELETGLHHAQTSGRRAAADDESFSEPGVARLAITVAEPAVVGVLSGPFDTAFETIPVRPAVLNTIAYDGLQALQRPGGDPLAACRALHDLLVAPFLPILERHGIKILVVQTHGALRRIPFGVLHDGSRYLLERYAIVEHPGGRPLDKGSGLRQPIVAASAAVPDTPGLKPLQSAAKDVRSLQDVLTDSGVGRVERFDPACANDVALEALWQCRPTLLHVSAHFEVNEADASRSGFVMRDGSCYSLARLARQDLSSVDLALMLGCGTQSASEVGGAMGITAIDALLLRMGVGTVIGTAWEVRDDVAHAVITRFLTAVFVERLDLAEALRRALLEVARNDGGRMRPAHQWGCFTLSGRWAGLR